ncbi:MAG: V-type ATPase subunit subunit G family protein [Candidatus Edwardsbacteria bacterium]|nr:V-type ATPase subunit subunit G family protein [Candidatus Edwardsbacteria bacterium]
MPSRHDNHQDQALAVIQSLAERERELAESVERSKAEAQRILEQAQSDAARIRSAAVAGTERQAALHQKRMAAVAAEVGAARSAWAKQEAEKLKTSAAAKLEAAVSEVIARVLPGKV